MLRDRIVCGCRDKRLQCKLLAEPKLTLETAFSTAQSMELAEKGSKDIRPAESQTVHAVQEGKKTHKQSGTRKSRPSPADRDTSCHRCGGKNHSPDVCKYKTYKCNHCNLVGHLQKVCRNKSKTPGTTRKKSAPTNQVEVDVEEEYEPLYYSLSNRPSPIVVTLTVNGAQLPMQVDTGASLSIISEETYRTLWTSGSTPPLQESDVKLKTYQVLSSLW